MYNPLTERIDLFSELPKDYKGNPFKPKKEEKDISRKTIIKGVIAIYLGKKIIDLFKRRSGDKRLKRVEKMIGKKNLINLDLYSSERDATIVETVVLRFNEVLGSPNPKSVIKDDLHEYEVYYTAAIGAIDRSSPDPVNDKDYIETAFDMIKYLANED